MPCFHPLKGYRSAELSPSGKRRIVFSPLKALQSAVPIGIPCCQCIGCRVDKGLHWAVRCHHEAQMHDCNSFVTFTYNPQSMPQDYSLHKSEFQAFLQKLRTYARRKALPNFRFLAAGEYGDESGHPHFHCLFFGFDPPDKYKWGKTEAGHQKWRSEFLEKTWAKGQVDVGSVTFDSAGYVGRYCLKKINGDRADDHYTRLSPIDGKVYRVEPEFLVMSSQPGIGRRWFDKYWQDAFPSDFLVVDGRKVTPPPYYLRLYEAAQAKAAQKVRRERKRRSVQPAAKADATPARLEVRERVLQARLDHLSRPV